MLNVLTVTVYADEGSAFLEFKHDIDPFVEFDSGGFAGEALSTMEGKATTRFGEGEEINVVANVGLGSIDTEFASLISEAHVEHEFLGELIDPNDGRHFEVMIAIEPQPFPAEFLWRQPVAELQRE